MASTCRCNVDKDMECRDKALALTLKLGGMSAILAAGAFGIALPLLGRKMKYCSTVPLFFAVAKAFAAGVILATGFVHMLPNGMGALTSPCLPQTMFRRFPLSGFVALLASLLTLGADVAATEYYAQKHIGDQVADETSPDLPLEEVLHDNNNTEAKHEHANGHPGHSHISPTPVDTYTTVRHVVISQVLEMGVALHSVIIGIALGVSHSPCIIRPLVAALSFHQFFEGFALGGCISQAGLKSLYSLFMALCFSFSTPFGISIGIGASSSYDSKSPRALVVEGVCDSVSAGILVYMALVDLIAEDFLGKRMHRDRKSQILSYIALFMGAIVMSSLAIWV